LAIRQRWGDGPGGKVLQRLLELAFHESGYRIVEERMSEGIDFDVEHREPPHDRYSFEARTTASLLVAVKNEDLRQMDERMRDGYHAGLAALHIGPGTGWVFMERLWLLPPSVRISLGTSACWQGLADRINREFDSVLEYLGPTARDRGLVGLTPSINQARR
jgi:hypothetical protein